MGVACWSSNIQISSLFRVNMKTKTLIWFVTIMLTLVNPVSLLVALLLTALTTSTPNSENEEKHHVIQLSPYNPYDMYLVSQTVVVVYSLFTCLHSIKPDPHSPLGQAAAHFVVRGCQRCSAAVDPVTEHRNLTTVWNRRNGRLMLAVHQTEVDSIVSTFLATLEAFCFRSADAVFEQLLGIHGTVLSEQVIDVYLLVGQRLAQLYGIGSKNPPKILINLNAMIVYRADMSRNAFAVDATTSPLKELVDVDDLTVLIEKIASGSLLLEAYAFWDRVFILTDAEFEYRTALGKRVSHLLGDKRMINELWRPVADLVDAENDDDELFELLANLMGDVAVDDSMDGRFERLFAGADRDRQHCAKFEL